MRPAFQMAERSMLPDRAFIAQMIGAALWDVFVRHLVEGALAELPEALIVGPEEVVKMASRPRPVLA